MLATSIQDSYQIKLRPWKKNFLKLAKWCWIKKVRAPAAIKMPSKNAR